ncbi:MAG: DCC1-like thiol-disulfide oxidoreductase family protein [Gemmatimonadales bacterium]
MSPVRGTVRSGNAPRDWTANLAVFRIVYLTFGFLPTAVTISRWTFETLPHLPASLWAPISFFRLVPFEIAHAPGWNQVIGLAAVGGGLLGLIGLWTRPALVVATLASTWVFGLTENFGKIDHIHHNVWFAALLAVGPSAALASVDALRRARRDPAAQRALPVAAGAAAERTLRFVWVLLGLLYLAPGLAKFESAVLHGWATPENLQHVMWRKWFEVALFDPGFHLPPRIDRAPAPLLALFGWATIGFEVLFIVLVQFRRVRPWLALFGLAFHAGNGVLLLIWFRDLMAAYSALIDWPALGRRLGLRPLAVWYDGRCGTCRQAVAALESVDLFGTLAPAPAADVPAATLADVGITPGQLERDLYVVDGRRAHAGFEGYRVMAGRLPLLIPLRLLAVGPAAALGRRIYRRVADARACALGRPDPVATAPALPVRPVLAVGLLLAAGELAVSTVMFAGNDLREEGAFVSPAWVPKPVEWLVLGLSWRHPEWPFDQYPTFASPTPGTACLAEFVWVDPDGREVAFTPATFWAVTPKSGQLWTVTTALVQDPEPTRTSRTRDFARLLVRATPNSARPAVRRVRAYDAEYRLTPPGGSPARPIQRTLIFDLPPDSLAGPPPPGT